MSAFKTGSVASNDLLVGCADMFCKERSAAIRMPASFETAALTRDATRPGNGVKMVLLGRKRVRLETISKPLTRRGFSLSFDTERRLSSNFGFELKTIYEIWTDMGEHETGLDGRIA